MNPRIRRTEVHDLLRKVTDPVIVDRCLLILAQIEYPDASYAQLSSMIDVPVQRVSAWSRLLETEGMEALLDLRTRRNNWVAYSDRPVATPNNKLLPADMAHLVNGRLLAFLDGMIRIDQQNWTNEADEMLGQISPEVDLARSSVRVSANLHERDHTEPPLVITNATEGDGLGIVEQGPFLHYWKAELLNVIRSPSIDFQSDAYSLPIAHDFQALSNGTYIGSIYLFRNVENGPFSLNLRSLVKQLETQITSFLLTRILWKQTRSPLLMKFSEAVRTLPVESPLTPTENKVAALLIAGENEKEIADDLSLSVFTIRNHKKAIYKKAGVSSLSELFSRTLSDGFFER